MQGSFLRIRHSGTAPLAGEKFSHRVSKRFLPQIFHFFFHFFPPSNSLISLSLSHTHTSSSSSSLHNDFDLFHCLSCFYSHDLSCCSFAQECSSVSPTEWYCFKCQQNRHRSQLKIYCVQASYQECSQDPRSLAPAHITAQVSSW